MGASTADQTTHSEPMGTVGIGARVLLLVFCLVAGVGYRAGISLVPGGWAPAFVLGLAFVLLALALLAKRHPDLERYWLIPFAFFVFAVAGFFGDGAISPVQHFFVHDVLHETTSANNPLASSVVGSVLAQVVGTALLAVPILVLTRASGADLRSIFIARPANWWAPAVGAVAFVLLFVLTVRGRTESFFPTHGSVTQAEILSLAPALIVLVLLNGFREELWFRGLFLNKYGLFLGPAGANVLAAVIFTSFHVQVTYSASILAFLAYAFIDGLVLGWFMQKSRSIWGSVLFHAATDIPIFLVYLTYTSH